MRQSQSVGNRGFVLNASPVCTVISHGDMQWNHIIHHRLAILMQYQAMIQWTACALDENLRLEYGTIKFPSIKHATRAIWRPCKCQGCAERPADGLRP